MKYLLPLALVLSSLPTHAGLLEWLGLRSRNPEHVTHELMEKLSQESWKMNPGSADTCPAYVNVEKTSQSTDGQKSSYHFSTSSEPGGRITSFDKDFVVDHEHKNKKIKECEADEVMGKACEVESVKIKKGVVSFSTDSTVKMTKAAIRESGLKQINGGAQFVYDSNKHSLQFTASMTFKGKKLDSEIAQGAGVVCSYSQLPKGEEVAEEPVAVESSDRAIAVEKPQQDEVLEEVPEDGDVVAQ